MQHTRDYFGDCAIELSGIVVDPEFQKFKIGTTIVKNFIDEHCAEYLMAYTRNPSILRILGNIAGCADVLNQASLSIQPPLASMHDGILYHLERYAPNGLYGLHDPADQNYNGEILKSRCKLLSNPNNALATSVKLGVKNNE